MRPSHRLRIKFDTNVADPAWHNIQRHPNSWQALVAGTPTVGTYSIDAVPESGDPTITNPFINTGEDSATTADELRQVIDANPGMDPLLASVADDDAGTIQAIGESILVPTPHVPYRVDASAPGAATITVAPDDVFPITVVVPDGFNAARFTYRGLDSSGDELPNASPSTRMDIDVVIVREGKPGFGVATTTIASPTQIIGQGLSKQHTQGDLAPGEEITVRISSVTDPNASLDAIEVWVEWLKR